MRSILALLVLVASGPLPTNAPPPDRPLTPREEHRLLLELAREIEEGREEAQAGTTGEIGTTGDDAPPDGGTEAHAGTQRVPEPWASLADCESGDWIDGGADFVEGSARWAWAKPGTAVPPWGTRIHHGGLQHHPDTWRWVAGDLGLLDAYPHAYDAPPSVQVEVAEEVQRRQGWGAWPVCSRKIGLR